MELPEPIVSKIPWISERESYENSLYKILEFRVGKSEEMFEICGINCEEKIGGILGIEEINKVKN